MIELNIKLMIYKLLLKYIMNEKLNLYMKCYNTIY